MKLLKKNVLLRLLNSYSKLGSRSPFNVTTIVLYSMMVGVIMVKFSFNCSWWSWWDRFLFAFSINFSFTIIKEMLNSKEEKKDKIKIDSENDKEKKINNSSTNIECSTNFKESNNIKENIKNIIKDNKNSNENKDKKNKFINRLVKFIINIILGLIIYLVVGVEFGYFNGIYCEPTDGESNNNVNSNKDNFIASVLESGEELSPLHNLINHEIVFSILIFGHIGILLLIWLHKWYLSISSKVISKFLSPNLTKKYENYRVMIEKIGNSYLTILIIINVLFILFYLCVIIYVNIELSNNIEDYISVHLNMKKGIIFLIMKFNLIVKKNKVDKIKYFNTWNKVESKKRKDTMFNVDFESINRSFFESKDKNIQNIIGVENVTRNNLISSENNIITISTENKEEKMIQKLNRQMIRSLKIIHK